MKRGIVYLVGAGPGDPELLTLKAARLLETADAVVYDRLVSAAVIAMAPATADRFDVGKAPGRHTVSQKELNELLVRLARDGKKVVRLKGGDPFVFGRGAEEALALSEEGVAFEVVPGISSAVAAPAAAGIPLTCRGVAASVAIVSGHGSAGSKGPDWMAVARLDTIVVLMATGTLDLAAEALMAAGRPGSTPAAVVERAFWAGERTVAGTLETIGAATRLAGVESPATLVVGDVAGFGQRLGLRSGVSWEADRESITGSGREP
ncbi:MAG: uroporphyrinogen-III C-methyltransferase [Vicinamibacterales bacterium]